MRIERFSSRADADLARTLLVTNGIPAYVSGDDAGGLHPEIPYGIGGTAVVVPEDRYAEAIALLDDGFGGDPVDDAELEAAAMAAGPVDAPAGEASTERERGQPEGGATSTRRSGGRRPIFLLVVAVMLAAVLTSALLLTALDVLVW